MHATNQFNHMSDMVTHGQHEALAQMLETLSMRDGEQIASMLLFEAVRCNQVACVSVLTPMAHEHANGQALIVACILGAHDIIDVLAPQCSQRTFEIAYHQRDLHYQTQKTLLKHMMWLSDDDMAQRTASLALLERKDIESQLSDKQYSKHQRKM